MARFQVDKEYVSNVAKQLIQINTVNDPTKVNDYWEGINYLKERMDELGMEVTIAGKEHFPNIIGRLKGNGKSKHTLMFNAHLDTVPEGDIQKWDYGPFEAVEKDGWIYGRGACDMKGQIAFLLGVVKYIKDHNLELAGELALSFVTGHETGSINGSVWIVENKPELFKADLCFIPEATSGNITVSSRGILWLRAKTTGLMGHSATYNSAAGGTRILPVNANHQMLRFAQRLLDVDSWMAYEQAEHVGPADGMYSEKPIVEMNMIHGGHKQNTVPDQCEATFDIRFLPGQKPDVIMEELSALADRMKAEDPDFRIELETDMLQYPPIEVDEDSEIYRLGANAYKQVYGKYPQPVGVCSPGCAVAFGRLMPVVWQGINWCNVHGYNECFEIDDACRCAEVYLNIVQEYLIQG